jgi:hypothetical protein
MSSSLKTYRIYCFDAALKMLNTDMIEAASDEAVITHAETAGFGSKCEIWDGQRLVARLEAERKQA